MNSNLTNTPVMQKSQAEYEKEMKETTKRELEKLSKLMEEKVKNGEFQRKTDEIIYEEEFASEDSELELSDTSEEKMILETITGIRNRKQKKKEKVHEQKSITNSLVNNVVMVEKLKNEINQLESRIRYKDLDMVNLTVEKDKLELIKDKYNLFEEIYNKLQEKEIMLNDKMRDYREIKDNKSKELKKMLFKKYAVTTETLDDILNNKYNFNETLEKIGVPMFTKMIKEKNDKLNKEYDEIKSLSLKQIQKINTDEETEILVLKGFLFILGVCALLVLKYVYY